jgi:hypothetical protein
MRAFAFEKVAHFNVCGDFAPEIRQRQFAFICG